MRSARIAFVLGLIDASSALAYAFDYSIEMWHGVTLVLKLILIVALRPPLDNVLQNIYFLLPLAVVITIELMRPFDQPAAIQAVGFLAHLIASLALLQRGNVLAYCWAIAGVCSTTAVGYLVMVYIGSIDFIGYRYFYFNNSHPNLGSEIFALGCFAAGLSLGRLRFLIAATPMVVAIFLMEGRAALLVCTVVVIVRIVFTDDGRLNHQAAAIAAIAAALGIVIFAVTNTSAFERLISDTMLLNDPYRGIDSRLVGREDRWAIGWRHFLSNPLFGLGLVDFDPYGMPSPHNLFLIAFAQFGLLALIPIGYIFVRMYSLRRVGIDSFLIFMSVVIFMMLNDRLFNLNLYPFAYYLILFSVAPVGYQKKGAGSVPVSPSVFLVRGKAAEQSVPSSEPR